MCVCMCVLGEGHGMPLQYSCLENSIEGEAWWATVHGVAKSWTWLSDFTFTFHFHALEKEMATNSSVLAWRIPGMGKPGGLLSMGSHRVGHHWSDLAAAAAVLDLILFSHVWLLSLLSCHPMVCSLPGLSVHGRPQARISERVAMPPPGDLPDPGIKPTVSPESSASPADSLLWSHPGSPWR